MLALVAVVIVATQQLHRSAHPAAHSSVISSPTPSSSTPSATPTPTISKTSKPSQPSTPAPKPTTQPRAAVDAAVRKLSAQLPAGGVSVSALDTQTGAHYRYGATSGMRTGSVYKLFVLEALLLQHQDEGTQLTDDEVELATPMIENSDNKAAYQLFLDVGGNGGLVTAANRLGLAHTVPGQADPALTTMSADDGLALLKNLVTNRPLSQYSRGLALGLMHNVESDQRWGVGAVADPGTSFAIKNGWLQVDNSNGADEDDNSLWLVNSIGVVTVRHQQVLMAVFTQHGQSLDGGISLVQSLAKAIAPAVVAH